MKKACFVLLLLISVTCFSQTERKFSTFASAQYNHTLYDQKPFNKTGIAGLGMQVMSNVKKVIRATMEVHIDLFNEHGIGAADEPAKQTTVIPSVYIGAALHPTDRFFIAATAGSSFFDKVHFAIRSSVGFYPCSTKNWLVKASFTNVFQSNTQNKDFGYLSAALAVKL